MIWIIGRPKFPLESPRRRGWARSRDGAIPARRGPTKHPSPTVALMEHYANAVWAEPWLCWRMVSRGPGFRMGSPTDRPEPVRWMGRAMVGKRRMRLWSCDGHVDGLGELRPVNGPVRYARVETKETPWRNTSSGA
jgi:hypothetical protein